MTSLSEQDRSGMGGRLSVLTMQKYEHVRLDELLQRVAAARASHDRRAQDVALLEVYRLVFPHAFAEESVLWPIMRRHLPDGERLTLMVEQEHQEVNEIVTSLDDDRLPSARREALLDRLTEVLRQDVRDEEDELFPALQAWVSRDALQRYGIAWWLVRRVSPTRPHPVVSRRPPGNALAALPLTVLDRSRDRLERWALHERPGADRAVLASRALARVAGRLERLGLLRSGEDGSTAVRPSGGRA